MFNDLGVPFFPASDKGIVVTLDGVLQEPGVAYNISGDQIVFAAPPLGAGDKLETQASANGDIDVFASILEIT